MTSENNWFRARVEGLMITACPGDRNAAPACEEIRRVHGELLVQLPARREA